MKFRLHLLALALLATSCSEYSTITDRRPVFQPLRSTAGAVANFEQQLMKAGQGGKKRDPFLSLGDYLSAAHSAELYLRDHPDDPAARGSYNFAVARIFTCLRTAQSDPWAQPLRVQSDSGEYVLDRRPDARKQWHPSLYDFKPVDEIDAKGLYVTEQMRKDGLGAPLVAVGKQVDQDARSNYTMDRVYYGVTAIARFEGRRCIISFEDPLATEEVTFAGHRYPLAADFTMPMAVMLASTNPKKMELARLLRPQNYAETARISRLQPYDPNKAVVLVIHGLKDSPATWAPMINSLRAERRIRENYQFWFYSYPSGYPYPYSASILRRELDKAEAKFKPTRPIVVIGHSMGGCISRLLITDADEKLWLNFFGKPPSQVNLSPETKSLFQEALIFRHRPEVGRVIFVAAPLKGSDLATGWVGRIGSKLVRSPATLLNAGTEALKALATTGDSLKAKAIPNSVDTLSPDNRFVKEINKLPITPGIPYHTIMGDRGKGGNHDKTSPVQSDGIVPYWSSHMPGAQSELVVPSGHSAHQNPQAIKEVARILRLNIGNTNR